MCTTELVMQSLYAAAVDGCAAFDSGKIEDVVA